MASTSRRCPSTYRGSGFRGFALRRAGSGISGLTGRVRTLATDLYLNPAYSDAATGPCAIENVLEICARQKRTAKPLWRRKNPPEPLSHFILQAVPDAILLWLDGLRISIGF